MKIISKKTLAVAGIAGTLIAMSACSTTPTKTTATETTAKPTGVGKAQAVQSVDLNRYAGKWYEIARLPMFFQRNCASDVTALTPYNRQARWKSITNVWAKMANPCKALGKPPKMAAVAVNLKLLSCRKHCVGCLWVKPTIGCLI